ncbi:hypothetical protein F1188_10945 [Roseospira marina]|uniref:Uncharacterized protein n=1 Tax=Roseospira marina TaxID=140057 RepID=A0A5M6IB07_9PROT|nr:hypothetical protein [Roseospira marina]KAA5605413.1 hypothetical protein F1188_10945 [Roseospira marina]MBB4314596.1 hypothetical protein [Roseospira marina]MBB5088799.1 hypothetical protein [Roseospira marina]
MAFAPQDLSVLCYANGFTLWHYTTDDTAAAVTGARYFDPAAPYVRVGDVMICNTDTDGTPGAALYRVAGNADGAVSVAAV